MQHRQHRVWFQGSKVANYFRNTLQHTNCAVIGLTSAATSNNTSNGVRYIPAASHTATLPAAHYRAMCYISMKDVLQRAAVHTSMLLRLCLLLLIFLLLQVDLQPVLQLQRSSIADLIKSMACYGAPVLSSSSHSSKSSNSSGKTAPVSAAVLHGMQNKAGAAPLRLQDLPNAAEIAAMPEWKQIRHLHQVCMYLHSTFVHKLLHIIHIVHRSSVWMHMGDGCSPCDDPWQKRSWHCCPAALWHPKQLSLGCGITHCTVCAPWVA